MKNINKIIGIIGLLFCVLQPISAQFRMGIDWSCGMPKSYFYSTRYYDDEGTYMPTAHAGFSFEYVLHIHDKVNLKGFHSTYNLSSILYK